MAKIIDPVRAAKEKLSVLPPGSRVAVITYHGSFCPITIGHVLCPVTARDILLRRQHEVFHDVVGFIKCNGDAFVGSKLAKKEPPVPIIRCKDRVMLIGLATEEYDWLFPHDNPRGALGALQDMFPKLEIIHFGICGADDAVKYKKWTSATPTNRIFCLGRPSDPGQDNGTAGVQKGMLQDGINPDAGHFILGPELPDISSTAVRKALQENDVSQLSEILHPKVMDWNLTEGPYAPAVPSGGAVAALTTLGEFEFWRGRKPFQTLVRNAPTASRADHVFLWNMIVGDGDLVCLMHMDDTQEFGYIEFDKGEGWVALKYLRCVDGSSGGSCTKAIHRRVDDVSHTPLRSEPSDKHKWVSGSSVANGEVVELLRPEGTGDKWEFFLARSKGQEGFLKVRNIAFSLSGL